MNKQVFFDSIKNESIFNDEFFKKVYGYAVSEKEFISKVAVELKRIGRGEVIAAYNEWYQEYLRQDKEEMKKVASWYVDKCKEWYKSEVKKVRKYNDLRDRYKFTGFSQDF